MGEDPSGISHWSFPIMPPRVPTGKSLEVASGLSPIIHGENVLISFLFLEFLLIYPSEFLVKKRDFVSRLNLRYAERNWGRKQFPRGAFGEIAKKSTRTLEEISRKNPGKSSDINPERCFRETPGRTPPENSQRDLFRGLLRYFSNFFRSSSMLLQEFLPGFFPAVPLGFIREFLTWIL